MQVYCSGANALTVGLGICGGPEAADSGMTGDRSPAPSLKVIEMTWQRGKADVSSQCEAPIQAALHIPSWQRHHHCAPLCVTVSTRLWNKTLHTLLPVTSVTLPLPIQSPRRLLVPLLCIDPLFSFSFFLPVSSPSLSPSNGALPRAGVPLSQAERALTSVAFFPCSVRHQTPALRGHCAQPRWAAAKLRTGVYRQSGTGLCSSTICSASSLLISGFRFSSSSSGSVSPPLLLYADC